MLQQSHFPSPTLLPLPALAIEFEQLGTHLEGLLLKLLVRFCFHFFGQVDYGLEVYFWGFWCAVIL